MTCVHVITMTYIIIHVFSVAKIFDFTDSSLPPALKDVVGKDFNEKLQLLWLVNLLMVKVYIVAAYAEFLSFNFIYLLQLSHLISKWIRSPYKYSPLP